MRPRLGVIAYGPIQYHTPLYQRLAQRGNVELDVLYLSDIGHRSTIDPEFGVPVAWDIDLLSGYTHKFMTSGGRSTSVARKAQKLVRWLPSHDAVVVNGYTSGWMLSAMALCRARNIPYLLRASSHPRGLSTGARRCIRQVGTRLIVAASYGGLSMGHLNEEFYHQNHARRVVFAPNSVDDQRFACPPSLRRAELLARWGLKDDKPVVIYCGKLYPGKRPLDLVAAINLLPGEVVTGFVNQSELPAYYHAADILVLPSEVEMWGLVINEGMAAGALPVVSDRVGCAPDLVSGIGEVYPCGDVPRLAAALARALVAVEDPETRRRMREHAERYSLEHTAEGFEQAAFAVCGALQVPPAQSSRATASGA